MNTFSRASLRGTAAVLCATCPAILLGWGTSLNEQLHLTTPPRGAEVKLHSLQLASYPTYLRSSTVPPWFQGLNKTTAIKTVSNLISNQ